MIVFDIYISLLQYLSIRTHLLLSFMMLIGRQIKAARALLGWDQAKLADTSGISLPTIRRIESQAGTIKAHTRSSFALESVLTEAGIEFLNGDAPGVRLKKLG
jgi:transcriptional regulator with XRE-family HTH domain